MLALLLALAVAQASGTPSREERVLELLRVLEREEGSWRYAGASFEWDAREGERPQLLPGYFLFCATNRTSVDGNRFRRLALELMRIYGLSPEADHVWTGPLARARLDGWDVERSIGFELRVPEPESDALDDAELKQLEAAGLRLYVADHGRYAKDGEEFTPALAFLAGFTRFLNEATAGEDVQLGGLLFERQATWIWRIELADGMSTVQDDYHTELVVEQPGVAVVACTGAPDFGRPRKNWIHLAERGPELPSSTRGAPSVVTIQYSVRSLESEGTRPEFRVRFRQLLDGKEHVLETRSMVILIPRACDVTRPFQLELDLAPGRYFFYGPARIGAAARE